MLLFLTWLDYLHSAPSSDEEPGTKNQELADSHERPYSYVTRGDQVHQVQPDGTLTPPDWSKTASKVALFRGWGKVRDAAHALLDAENDPARTDASLAPLRQQLNAAYDAHVQKFGPLSKARRNPHDFLAGDPDYPLTQALEDLKKVADPLNPSQTKDRYLKAPATPEENELSHRKKAK